MFIPETEIEFDFRSIIADKVPVEKVIRSTRIERLDVLPATFDLALLDKELVVSPSGVQRIEKALRDVREEYDYIVLDTGPNLSHLTLGCACGRPAHRHPGQRHRVEHDGPAEVRSLDRRAP